jgi:hypothetical protein
MFLNDGGLINYSRDGEMLYPRMHDPEVFAVRFGRMFQESDCLYLLCSPGLGYGLDWLETHRLPKRSRILIFERNPELYKLYDSQDSADEITTTQSIQQQAARSARRQMERITGLPQVDFCPFVDPIDQRRWLAGILQIPGPQRRVRSVRFCTIPSEYRGDYDQLESDASRIIRQWWRNHSTSLYMAPLWIRNIIQNLMDAEKGIGGSDVGELEKRIAGRRVLLCGAGASLEDYLDSSGEEIDACCLAAVDTAVPVLLEHGLVPELVFMLEGQFANMDDFICSSGFEVLNRADSLLIHDISSHPPTLRRFEKKLALVSRFAPSSLFDALSSITRGVLADLPPLGSVGVAALYILVRYSSAEIVFCGFDFAFPRGKTHAIMSPPHQRVLRRGTRLNPVCTWAIEQPVHQRLPDGLLSDGVMADYFARFQEVMWLYGHDRVRLGAHRGLEYPDSLLAKLTAGLPANGVTEIGEDREISASLKPQSGALRSWLQDGSNAVEELRGRIAFLLSRLSPSEEGTFPHDGLSDLHADSALRDEWQSCLELMGRWDLLWRFLPGVSSPDYSPRFLRLLSGSLDYWSGVFRRSLDRSAIRDENQGN